MTYRQTSTQVIAEIIDNTAKQDSTISTSAKSFSSPNKLKNDNIITVDYMTNELNYSILDGTLEEIPSTSNNKFIYVSSAQSDSAGLFTTNPTITITFSNSHSSAGISLKFDGHYLPSGINVRYYTSIGSTTPIVNNTFNSIDSYNFFCRNSTIINNYKKIVITFTGTKYPNSYVKVNNIEYGVVFDWNSNDIGSTSSLLNAKILEETDIISNNLAMDTCEFTIYDEQDNFNIITTTGLYNEIQKYQIVKINEIIETYDAGELIDTKTILMGHFYIKEWTSNAMHEITFKCVDLLGVLDDIPFNIGAIYYDGTDTVKSIIDSIMSCAGIDSTMYNVPNETGQIGRSVMYGCLPLMSCREALQQVIFPIGAVADCARSDKINIYVPSTNISHTILDDNNLEYEQIQKNDMVSDVSIFQIDTYDATSSHTIFSGNLSVGNHRLNIPEIIYQQINSPTIITGSGTITGVGISHIDITVNTAGYFEITSKTYNTSKVASVSVHNNEAKIIKEVKCSNNYLIGSLDGSNLSPYAQNTANRLLNYYSKPNTMETEIILNDERTGNWCLITNKYGNQTRGNILRMDIDLTGGFLAKAKLVCVEDIGILEYTYTCGNDMYSGETGSNNGNIGLI